MVSGTATQQGLAPRQSFSGTLNELEAQLNGVEEMLRSLRGRLLGVYDPDKPSDPGLRVADNGDVRSTIERITRAAARCNNLAGELVEGLS